MKRKLGPKTLVHPLPAVLVGTYSEGGTPNAMTAAWCSTCCMDPPCVGVAVRRERLTRVNIERTRAFTVNIPSTSLAAKVDYIGIVSGRDQADKLDRAGMRTERAGLVDAPLVVDCPVCLECSLKDRLAIGSHTWFVGEVLEAHVDEQAFTSAGDLDPKLIDPLVYCSSDHCYYGLGARVARAFSAGKKLSRSPR